LHSTYQSLLTTLERYISRMNARALLNQAVAEAGGSLTRPRPEEFGPVSASLRRSVPLFVKEELRERAIDEIMAACGIKTAATRNFKAEITAERDIVGARSEARRICEEFGCSGFAVQRVTTVVSELARNIVSYTEGGSIELEVRNEGGRRMRITALDRGKGIPNLDEILSGKYRSRTGMGKGILGVKRLGDSFQIETGANGTKIEAEIRF
jgi:serine/threonine-protein kinase RsbT